MTIKECIDIVDNIKPNQYSIKDKVMWLSFLDETIINDVLKTHEGYDGRYDDFTGYTVDDLSVSLVVPSPYDRVYTAYLKMQIDKENGETARYNNSMALYNTYLLEYRKHYNKTHMPLSHDARPGRGVSVKVDVNLSEAEFEAIKRDVYNQLSEDVDEVISPDKLYDIVMSYVLNNTEMLKGKDGYTPQKGTDYFTEAEVTKIKEEAKGDDGYSPFVEIIPIEGGTRVYITDKNGRKFFDILNGADGKTVTNINQLEGADQYLKKLGGRASVDYGEEGIDVNINAQRRVVLGAEHVDIISEYEATFKANQGEIAADFSNQRITNIADPKSEKDGVNKKYVDEALKKISDFEVSVPTRTSDLVNDSGYITVSAIPEVPSKVSQLVNDMGYITAADIPPSGGTSGNVPTKVSQLENDAGYIANFADEIFVDEMNVTGTLHTQSIYGHEGIDISSEHTSIGSIDGAGIDFGGYNTDRNYGQIEGDMRVQTPVNDASVANKKYVDGEITAHNTSTTAHNDIRQLIAGLTSRLNAVANSDDTTLDQLSEIVAYIKANKSLIDSITTSKVNVSDIIDNLTTSVSNKPLSAKMGVELKKLIDAIKIPTTLPASDVYSWAKQPTKPTYTAAEVGAATPAYVDNKVNEIIKSAESIPEYWLSELENKADAIQQAMEKAGRNKSAFLWYTDAHWVNGNSKMSPVLLDYLYRNTPMNKVNFGGDIIGDSLLASREEMKYLYEWREAIKDLPNHHSVLGNHDMFASDSVDYEDDNYRYAIMIAPEESSDMVMGEGNYYYIDNPCEKTRYLHFAYLTSNHAAMMAQGQFMVDAIKGASEGWHIVAIAHRWWQYSSASTPTTGSIPAFETEMLSVFDAYNARTTRGGSNYFTAQDFASAKGKVEFCIAGHIHVDYDFETEGGIPIIITTADTNQNRVPDSTVDSGTVGTTTEAAVFGIIADYNDADNTKITVVGVGRGTSRVVRKSSVKLTSISDITYSGDTTVGATIDASKFSFTANYSNGTTDTVSGATSVSPATVGVVGNNSVTITYTEGNVSVSGTMTLVGTPVPVVNLFNKEDTDIAVGHRIRSNGETQYQAEGQLVTGWIEVKAGDTIVITSDKACNTNSYTGTICCYDADKAKLGSLAISNATISADALMETLVIPTGTLNTSDYSGTTYMRCCIAYTDIDSIVITKS